MELKEFVRYEVMGRYRGVRVVENIITIEGTTIVSTKRNHSRMIMPGQDYSQESNEIKSLCEDLHTPETIEEYKAMVEANQED